MSIYYKNTNDGEPMGFLDKFYVAFCCSSREVDLVHNDEKTEIFNARSETESAEEERSSKEESERCADEQGIGRPLGAAETARDGENLEGRTGTKKTPAGDKHDHAEQAGSGERLDARDLSRSIEVEETASRSSPSKNREASHAGVYIGERESAQKPAIRTGESTEQSTGDEDAEMLIAVKAELIKTLDAIVNAESTDETNEERIFENSIIVAGNTSEGNARAGDAHASAPQEKPESHDSLDKHLEALLHENIVIRREESVGNFEISFVNEEIWAEEDAAEDATAEYDRGEHGAYMAGEPAGAEATGHGIAGVNDLIYSDARTLTQEESSEMEVQSELLHNGSFLPEKIDSRPTLVLDLDNTLVYPVGKKPDVPAHEIVIQYKDKEQNIWIVERPHLQEFLDELHAKYEIVLFTAGIRQYGQKVLEKIDKEGRIREILDRRHCTVLEKYSAEQGIYVKNLALLGRDLRKMIIVDDREYSYVLNFANGQYIPPYNGDPEDRALAKLKEYLLRCLDIPDFRQRECLDYNA